MKNINYADRTNDLRNELNKILNNEYSIKGLVGLEKEACDHVLIDVTDNEKEFDDASEILSRIRFELEDARRIQATNRVRNNQIQIVEVHVCPVGQIKTIDLPELTEDLSLGTGNVMVYYEYVPVLDIVIRWASY